MHLNPAMSTERNSVATGIQVGHFVWCMEAGPMAQRVLQESRGERDGISLGVAVTENRR